MRVAILKLSTVTMLLAGLAATTGCSVSGQAARSTTPATFNVADTSNDPSWTPPGEDLVINDSDHELSSPKTDVEALSMPQPNRRAIVKNQLHAAHY